MYSGAAPHRAWDGLRRNDKRIGQLRANEEGRSDTSRRYTVLNKHEESLVIQATAQVFVPRAMGPFLGPLIFITFEFTYV